MTHPLDRIEQTLTQAAIIAAENRQALQKQQRDNADYGQRFQARMGQVKANIKAMQQRQDKAMEGLRRAVDGYIKG